MKKANEVEHRAYRIKQTGWGLIHHLTREDCARRTKKSGKKQTTAPAQTSVESNGVRPSCQEKGGTQEQRKKKHWGNYAHPGSVLGGRKRATKVGRGAIGGGRT